MLRKINFKIKIIIVKTKGLQIKKKKKLGGLKRIFSIEFEIDPEISFYFTLLVLYC